MLVNHSKIASFRSAEASVDETPEISFLVPDEKLRTVLNNQLEIIVADTVYKVTKEGTFYTNVSNISNLDKAIE